MTTHPLLTTVGAGIFTSKKPSRLKMVYSVKWEKYDLEQPRSFYSKAHLQCVLQMILAHIPCPIFLILQKLSLSVELYSNCIVDLNAFVGDNTIFLHVITFLASAAPGPALVDAVIAQLYWVAGMNIPTVALRVSLMISSVTVMFTGWPLPLGMQTMLYSVMIPFRWSGGGSPQKKSTISGTSSNTENIKFCGGASGARGEE